MSLRACALALLLAAATTVDAGETADVRIISGSERPQVVIHAEVVRTPKETRRGLMGRRELAADAGMLFLFPEERIRRFWMKNCFISLDMIFADRPGRVVHVEHDVPPCPTMRVDCPTYSSQRPAAVVLEVPAGTAERHEIGVGSRLEW